MRLDADDHFVGATDMIEMDAGSFPARLTGLDYGCAVS